MCLRVFEFGPQLLVGNYLFAFVIIFDSVLYSPFTGEGVLSIKGLASGSVQYGLASRPRKRLP